ncbi:MAG: diguanylate cyclase, partial [Lachnospiraceae bacterium]|nr:diguanylate cyclase [Lachnospiraceae bacterium]
SFSAGWTTDTGEVISLEEARMKYYYGEIVAQKKLPQNLSDEDCLSFETGSVAVTVWIDDREVYSCELKENLTGLGYGTAFHQIALTAADSGHTIKMRLEGLYHRYGRIRCVRLGAAADYIHSAIRTRLPSALISLLIVFVGLIMIVVYVRIPDKENMPFDILALSALSIIVGGWLLLDTQILQLLTGYVHLWRDLNRMWILFACYPCVCFTNSITEQKKRIYLHIAFWYNLVLYIAILALRFLAGVDMIASFSRVMAVISIGTLVLVIIIQINDAIYCRSLGLRTRIRSFYPGVVAFLICAVIDIMTYLLGRSASNTYGNFSRVGMLLFLLVSMGQFLGWWTRDRETIERDRFINRFLQYAVSANSMDDSIQAMLSYMGSELKAERIGIFEDQSNGRFRGKYEWYRDGLASADLEMMVLPYEGVVDELYRIYESADQKLIVRDTNEVKTASPVLYQQLITYGIKTIVWGPLKSGGHMTGFLLFVNSPEEMLDETAEIISLISYFLTQMIMQREEQKRLRFYSYNDSLSGALNRRAYKEYLDGELDLTAPFGYVSVYINGFETVNNSQGYEAGDRMARDLVQALKEVFGPEHVYRLAGAGFAVFGFETDESYFESDVERARRLTQEKGLEISFGSVYCAYGTMSIDKVIRHAEELMRADL